MNSNTQLKAGASAPALIKADARSPAILVTGPASIAIKAGTVFGGADFAVDTPVAAPGDGFAAGVDYAVRVAGGMPAIIANDAATVADDVLGGFHFAPGGNAPARAGGDTAPAINPTSVWDRTFRPTCADLRGMALVEGPHGKFWCDIYLLGEDHLEAGTSRHGVTIADGEDPPQDPAKAGKKGQSGWFAVGLDYETAKTVMTHHGKGLLAIDEFFAAAFGVTEKTAIGKDPKETGLDAPRTSKWGIMQATGNLWVWGHDGDPGLPRASIFGGSWWRDGRAGSRCASLGYWPEHSYDNLGARGRCDHLQPA